MDRMGSDAAPLGVFCVKNGLSALLMSALATQRPHGRRVAIGNFRVEPPLAAAIEQSIAPGAFDLVLAGHPRWLRKRLALERLRIFPGWPLRRQPYALYHTCSYDSGVNRLIGLFGPPAQRFVLDHGLVETLRYIDACRAGEPIADRTFLLLFHDEVMRYLRERGVEPSVPAAPYPLEALRTQAAAPRLDAARSLFAVQPLVDDGVITEIDCREVMERFLERRPPRRYLIKNHPRGSARTGAVVAAALARRGLAHEEAPDFRGTLEESLPRYGCGELSTFFSTSCLTAGRLHGISYAWAVPELLRHATFLIQEQQDLVRLVADVFSPDAGAAQASASTP